MDISQATLGLDLGPNSIGWALIDEEAGKIIATGVRIFPEGVDNFDTAKEQSRSADRRMARAMRRQIARRARRRKRLREALIAMGLLPSGSVQFQELMGTNPYELRRRALDEQLTPHEIGRTLLHLTQRRGFLSNRKSDKKKADTKGLLAEISQLAGEISNSGCRTLGEFLARQQASSMSGTANGHRLRARHTRRDMYESEFEAIWESQRRFHGEMLTDELKYGARGRRSYPIAPPRASRAQTLVDAVGLHGLIFFQRRLRPVPRSVVGRCELEPKLRRCPKADRLAQRFRMLQEVNNLRYVEPKSRDELPLTGEQRALLLDKLSKKKEMAFDEIRKALGFLETVKFNLETGHRQKLLGHATDAALGNKKVFGPGWSDRPDAERDAIVRSVLELDDRELLHRATSEWGLPVEAATALADVELPEGYLHLSRTALEKLVPHMERGLLIMTDDDTPSALSEAGYLRPDQRAYAIRDELPPPPDVANPVVRQALHEVRKVVNAVIREYGKPAKIHVELARNAKASTEERRRMSKQMRDREAERNAAADEIRNHGHRPTRDTIDRYLLWKQQSEHCPYCLTPISPGRLFGAETDVDHILPYSRCLDDSFQNKIVVCTGCNRAKANQTPYEWLAEREPARYEEVCAWARNKLPYPKYKRFIQKTLELDKFIQRQLNDTRYISRVVLNYVRCLLANPHDALGLKGEHTAALRRHWGLNTVLRHDDEDRKNREDHRHHAVDAIVVALTNRSRLQQLSALERGGGTDATGELIIEPWEGLRDGVVAVVNQINVSHRARRKVAGALHEDTLYGRTEKPGVFVVRKPLEALTTSMVADIRDETIRTLVADRLKQFGIGAGRKKRGASEAEDGAGGRTIPKEVWREPLRMPSGVPIKKVRILKADETIRPIRDGSACVKPGAIHHICLFEWQLNGKTKRDVVFVSMLEAIQRLKRGEQLIQQVHPARPDAKFLMSLSRGEMVLGRFKGKERLVCFKTCASTQGQLYFADHTDARRGSTYEKFAAMAGTLNGEKVAVDLLGRMRRAK
jgi:CRISPR-associated endonuclease Csn1